jgi:hypothetical protein
MGLNLCYKIGKCRHGQVYFMAVVVFAIVKLQRSKVAHFNVQNIIQQRNGSVLFILVR